MKKTYIYARESSTGILARNQLENQICGIENFARNNKIKIEDVVSEMVSASNFLNQKRLNNFFKQFKDCNLLVSSVDRFCRSYNQIQLIQNRLISSGCSITFIREQFTLDLSKNFENLEKFHKHVKFAHDERLLIVQRMATGKINKKMKRRLTKTFENLNLN